MKDKTFLLDWMSSLLNSLGVSSTDGGHKSLLACVVVLLCCILIWRLVRYILLRAHRLGKMVDEKWDVVDAKWDLIFNPTNLKKIAFGVALFMFYMLLPLAFDPASTMSVIVSKVLDLLIVLLLTSAANTVVKTIFTLIYHKRKTKDQRRPLEGLYADNPDCTVDCSHHHHYQHFPQQVTHQTLHRSGCFVGSVELCI